MLDKWICGICAVLLGQMMGRLTRCWTLNLFPCGTAGGHEAQIVLGSCDLVAKWKANHVVHGVRGAVLHQGLGQRL